MFLLGSIWNGNGFGFGGNRGGAVADVGLANSIEHVSDQVNQGTISQLQSASQNQMATMGASANIANAINGVNVTSLQNTQQISNALCNVNQNITNQGYESRLLGQSLASQLASQHADLSRQIFEENCKDRELTREIATQALRDKLAESAYQIEKLKMVFDFWLTVFKLNFKIHFKNTGKMCLSIKTK